MFPNDRQNIAAARKYDKRFLTLLICFIVVAAIAVGAVGGLVGYNLRKNNVTVLHATGGETVSSLSTGGTRTITDVVDDVADSVVEINCTVKVTTGGFWRPSTTLATGAGSGVIIAENGYIVTNNHVIENATAVTVRLRDGKTYDASLVGTDERNDIAVIKIEAENLAYATFGESAALKVGQTVVVIGNPLGVLGGTVTDGIVSALDRDISIDGTTMRLLQTNASINSGNSGGGMFDLDGRLVGIVNAKSTGTNVEGLGFAIPSDTAREIVTKILDGAKTF